MVGEGIWPVVHRELRAGARRPLNHWMRVGGALGGVIIFGIAVRNTPITSVGGQIFLGIHQLLILMILCIVPAITADCISRERREGTLGLLFMTPLRSWEIVVGKVIAQVLTASILWLAVIPMLAVPFVLGGVSKIELAGRLCVELCAGMFCVAAGIVATSLTDKRAMAFVLAFTFAATSVFVATGERLWDIGWLRPRPQMWVQQGVPGGMIVGPQGNVMVTQGWVPGPRGGSTTYFYNLTGIRRGITRAAPTPTGNRLYPLCERLLLAILVLWAAIRFAGFRVERSWQDRVPSARRAQWEKFCSSPVFRSRFERGMKTTLEWNPIAWLQQYSWKARLTKWGLCLGFTVLMCMATAPGSFPEIIDRGPTVLAILAAVYTYAGVNGFLQEKKTGALELILVTPLSVNEIIWGRVYGLWKQFFPSALLVMICIHLIFVMDLQDIQYQANVGNETIWILTAVSGFLVLPVYATLAALLVKNVVIAAAGAWLGLLAAPSFAAMLTGWPMYQNDPAPTCLLGVLIQGPLIVLAFKILRYRLCQRDYAT
jgi:ABC-type Na+ efflux pump permease subunit